jgi:hypothetical protein
MQDLISKIVDKYSTRLGVSPFVTYFNGDELPAVRFVSSDNELRISLDGFLLLYYRDRNFATKFLNWSIAHDLAHVRQRELRYNMNRTNRSIDEADADFVAERLTGTRPIDAHKMIMQIKRFYPHRTVGDYPKRKKDWKLSKCVIADWV